ncbi:MAG TPA: putative Ig domain-containing protein [Thermoanaerobaculia bacterium]|nr:putative Ig domain-containing protein [Thermoanaerobaculia bacterium]
MSTPRTAQAAGHGKGAGLESGRARPAFTIARTPEERRSLFEAWKKQHSAQGGSVNARRASVIDGTVQSYVGRASMVINSAGTVLYTKNFLGNNATCDPNVEAGTTWTASTAFAAGVVVRPASGFNSPNGFRGFNFQSSGGTSGASEPVWPTTIGATVTDGTITWTAIGFDPADFVGCQPMQIVSRASGGAETVLAQEGATLADGSQLAGWSEFMAMNESGLAGFRGALAGYLWNDGEDEGESGVFTAGPGAGALTRVAVTNTTIGGRTVCGFSAMVGINGGGQLVYDAYAPFAVPTQCDEDNHGIVRFTPGGTGNELLVQQGSTIGTPSSTVIGFGLDDDTSGGGSRCVGCEYELIDGFINSAGHVPVVLNLADGTQGVFILTGPGTAIQVVRGPAGTIGPRVSINDADQVVYRATTGGVDHLFRFTPPSTNTIIVSVGDSVGGSPIDSIAPYSDINAGGHVVYGGTTTGGAQDAYYFWNGTASTRIVAATASSLASEMLTINDADQVAYVTGMSSGPEDPNGSAEMHETGGVFSWTLSGGSSKLIQVGDVIGGQAVTSIYAEHPSFARRQWSQAGCVATTYSVLGDDPDFDCSEGGTGFCNPPLQRGGQLFVSCATGVCPVITIAPPTLPAGTQGTPYSQQLVASGGQAPYTFTVSIGVTPPGTNLSAGGLLNGTPTTTGTFNFTVTATDANNCTGTIAYSLVIGAPTQVTIALAPPARLVVVGNSSNFTASINIPQSTDTIVTLTSSNPSIATVPATATILANQTSVIFTVNGVALGGPITVTATLPPSFGATPATASVTVVAAPAATVPTLSTWALILLAAALAAAGSLLSKRL